MSNRFHQFMAVMVASLVLFEPGMAMAAGAQSLGGSGGSGLGTVVDNVTEVFNSIETAIPIVAVVLGAISFMGGLWAFRQAGNQQAPQKWQMGAVVAIVVGAFLLYWTTSQEMFGATLFG